MVDNVAAARYVAETRPNIKTVASIQQNYAWGQDSWNDFILTLKQIKPEIKVVSEQWPKLAQGQYGAEISALSVSNPDVIHSSFWGGDMEALMLQGGNDWFRPNFTTQFKEPPTYPAYKMVQAILGLKAAAEKSAKAGAMPTADQIVKGLTGLTFEAPSGTVTMSRAKGHQAVQSVSFGEYQFDAKSGKAALSKVKTYAGECQMPPDGSSAADWIKAGFPGAKCS